MLTIGINSRAVGVLTSRDAYKAAFELARRSDLIDGAALRRGLKQAAKGHEARVVIEKLPGWDQAAEAIMEAVQPLGVPAQFVDQSHWHRGLALADFYMAPVRRANALFPEAGLLDVHVDRAAALLLAHWVTAGRRAKALTLPDRKFATSTRARSREYGRP